MSLDWNVVCFTHKARACSIDCQRFPGVRPSHGHTVQCSPWPNADIELMSWLAGRGQTAEAQVSPRMFLAATLCVEVMTLGYFVPLPVSPRDSSALPAADARALVGWKDIQKHGHAEALLVVLRKDQGAAAAGCAFRSMRASSFAVWRTAPRQ